MSSLLQVKIVTSDVSCDLKRAMKDMKEEHQDTGKIAGDSSSSVAVVVNGQVLMMAFDMTVMMAGKVQC
jgi:hypothetical protein